MTVTKCVFEYIPRFAKAKIERWACVINFWTWLTFPLACRGLPKRQVLFRFSLTQGQRYPVEYYQIKYEQTLSAMPKKSFFEDVPYLQKGTPPMCGRECLCSREPRTWPWLVDDLHIGACGRLPLVCPCSRTAAASYTSSLSTPQW